MFGIARDKRNACLDRNGSNERIAPADRQSRTMKVTKEKTGKLRRFQVEREDFVIFVFQFGLKLSNS